MLSKPRWVHWDADQIGPPTLDRFKMLFVPPTVFDNFAGCSDRHAFESNPLAVIGHKLILGNPDKAFGFFFLHLHWFHRGPCIDQLLRLRQCCLITTFNNRRYRAVSIDQNSKRISDAIANRGFLSSVINNA